MNKINQTLKEIGLSDNEVKVYLLSLSIGPSQASILGGKINIPRSTAKYTCESLVKKGLMSFREDGNSIQYTAEKPEKILSIIGKEYDEIDKKLVEAKGIMGDLNNLINENTSKNNIRYYSGTKGVIDLMDDVLLEGKLVYGIMDYSTKINPEIFKYSNEYYIPKKREYGITSHLLVNKNEANFESRDHDKSENRISMLIDYDLFPIDSCIQIYGDKVSFLSYKTDNIIGYIIEDKLIAKSMFTIFKMAWKFAQNDPDNSIYKDQNI